MLAFIEAYFFLPNWKIGLPHSEDETQKPQGRVQQWNSDWLLRTYGNRWQGQRPQNIQELLFYTVKVFSSGSRWQESAQNVTKQQLGPERQRIPPILPPRCLKFGRDYVQQMHPLLANWSPKQRSLVSRETLHCMKTLSGQTCKSDTNWWLHPSPKTAQGLYSPLRITLSATTTAFSNIATPLSQKKLLWVNEGSRTKSCTQAMISSTASWLMATQSKVMLNLAPCLHAPLTSSAAKWKT